MELRNYQINLSNQALSRTDNCLIQLDTGAGKSAIISDIAKKISGRVVIIAHTRLLIDQLRRCVPCNCEIIGVRTAIVRNISVDNAVLIIDEAHHVAPENQWYKLAKKAKRVIGFTATPHRLDGEPLGCIFDVLLQDDDLVENSVSKLIGRGILSDFVAYSAISESELDADRWLKMGKYDYTQRSLEKSMGEKLHLVCSSVIREYKKHADGLSALCFCVNIELAKKQSQLFNSAGIRSEVVSSKHSSADNDRNIQLFKEGFIKILCHVDMFGEGIDIPSLDCIIMTRKTASFSLYRQWCGRVLRVFDGKETAVILDHVGNIAQHGLPDRDIRWSLNGTITGESAATKTCSACHVVNKFFAKACVNCGENLLSSGAARAIIQREDLERRLIEWSRKENLLEKERQQRKWRESNVVHDFSIVAPNPLKVVLRDRIFSKVIEKLRNDGESIKNINKMIDNTKDYKVWVKYFPKFNLSRYREFYDQYSQ